MDGTAFVVLLTIFYAFIAFFLALLFSIINPTIPESPDAIKIANLASFCMSIWFLKDNKAMKIDIVKPIPAKNPVPIICIQLLPTGNELSFNWIATHEKSPMPNALPTKSPPKIPNPKLDAKPSTIPSTKVILVLAKAKIGMMRKLTGLWSPCSNFSNGEISVLETLVGMVNANSTPAMVA